MPACMSSTHTTVCTVVSAAASQGDAPPKSAGTEPKASTGTAAKLGYSEARMPRSKRAAWLRVRHHRTMFISLPLSPRLPPEPAPHGQYPERRPRGEDPDRYGRRTEHPDEALRRTVAGLAQPPSAHQTP